MKKIRPFHFIPIALFFGLLLGMVQHFSVAPERESAQAYCAEVMEKEALEDELLIFEFDLLPAMLAFALFIFRFLPGLLFFFRRLFSLPTFVRVGWQRPLRV